MTTWVPWIILALVVLALSRLFFSKAAVETTSEVSAVKYRYRKRNRFCTSSETLFLKILEKGAGGSIRVFSKVHAAHVLVPRRDLSIENWNASLDKIVTRRFDYVLCSVSDLSILCVVMISTPKNLKRSSFKFLQKACRSAGIPVITIPAEEELSPLHIRQLLKKHIPDAFPAKRKPDIARTTRIRQKKTSLSSASAQESLQYMLLREGQRRAQKVNRINGK
jgi:hypothetical protein